MSSFGLDTNQQGIVDMTAFQSDIQANTHLAPSEMVAAILEAMPELGLTFGENLFVGREPTEPDNCATIYDTQESLQEHMVNIDESRVQLRVKNTSYREGYQNIRKMKFTLQAIPCIQFQNTNLIGIVAMTSVAFIGRNTQEHSLFTCNFKLIEQNNQPGNRNHVTQCI